MYYVYALHTHTVTVAQRPRFASLSGSDTATA
jgi:hypothetical protein